MNSSTTPNVLIKSALSDTIKEINAGKTPTEALKKVAQEYDLNKNYIQRTGEALNVALHYNHFKNASDKAADFDIANTDDVIKSIFHTSEKTAAQKTHDSFGIDDPSINFNKWLTNPTFKKASAKFLQENTPTTEKRAMSQISLMEKSSTFIRDLEKAKNDVDTKLASSEYQTQACFSKLVSQFKKSADYRTPFDEFESQVFAKYGEESVPYIDLLFKAASPKYDERGVHDSKYFAFDDAPEVSMFASLMKASSDEIALRKEAKEIDVIVSENKAILKESYDLIGSELKKKSEEIVEVVKSEEKKDKEPATVVETTTVETVPKSEDKPDELISDSQIGKEAADLIQTLIDKFKLIGGSAKGPTLNTSADNFTRRRILQELILTDPILRSVDPKKVASAYEALLNLAPQLATQKEVVRAFLRQAVQTQGISPFDANQLVQGNTALAKQQAMFQGFSGNQGQENKR